MQRKLSKSKLVPSANTISSELSFSKEADQGLLLQSRQHKSVGALYMVAKIIIND
ncbi:hypothetical protein KIN20_020218 [Parelaphostrongylus tenuis]|uniref:Uncharacterized protein n=1 Tax=Parelaphostrongylus tenuis TaxID=148309 RepID=A0AAD5MM86_PARTN|nr:hypothetical protein KIN20_020218 [Parelaphostrongylus tenuis]